MKMITVTAELLRDSSTQQLATVTFQAPAAASHETIKALALEVAADRRQTATVWADVPGMQHTTQTTCTGFKITHDYDETA